MNSDSQLRAEVLADVRRHLVDEGDTARDAAMAGHNLAIAYFAALEVIALNRVEGNAEGVEEGISLAITVRRLMEQPQACNARDDCD